MKRCWCSTWRGEDVKIGFADADTDWEFKEDAAFKYCPWCSKPLGESKSQQNRLEIQLRGEDANK